MTTKSKIIGYKRVSYQSKKDGHEANAVEIYSVGDAYGVEGLQTYADFISENLADRSGYTLDALVNHLNQEITIFREYNFYNKKMTISGFRLIEG